MALFRLYVWMTATLHQRSMYGQPVHLSSGDAHLEADCHKPKYATAHGTAAVVEIAQLRLVRCKRFGNTLLRLSVQEFANVKTSVPRSIRKALRMHDVEMRTP